jgi:hypothetical protein
MSALMILLTLANDKQYHAYMPFGKISDMKN